MSRLIVCGSRSWSDWDLFAFSMRFALTKMQYIELARGQNPDRITVVHGACPSGADAMAARYCSTRPRLLEEPHPADWSQGKAAGPIRNSLMASAGARLCLAFWDGKSAGTLDMIRRATECGIATNIVPVAAKVVT